MQCSMQIRRHDIPRIQLYLRAAVHYLAVTHGIKGVIDDQAVSFLLKAAKDVFL